MIPILHLDRPDERAAVEKLLQRLRLDPAEIALARGHLAEANESVRKILQDVAERGDAALVDNARRFDDPDFQADQLRVTRPEMAAAAARVPAEQMAAIRRSIAQVREYQSHVMPEAPKPLVRRGVTLGMRFTPIASAGFYVPGGKASYPSTLIMLAVPAQVAGVGRITVCTPASRFGRSDLVLAAAHELGLTEVFRIGGPAAIGAMAFGTASIAPVDKIVGPGNLYVQLAKRMLAGCIGVDGFLGPSEIVTVADETGRPDFIAADLLAQAEHDPGSCFLLTDSPALADAVVRSLEEQIPARRRIDAIRPALAERSAIVVDASMDRLIDWANQFAAEHVNIQTRDNAAVLAKLKYGGAVFVGPYSPVAAGDYVAGPSHCLPTNTTARFTSGISVYEFLNRSSVEEYQLEGLKADGGAIVTLAEAEGLDAHAQSVRVRIGN